MDILVPRHLARLPLYHHAPIRARNAEKYCGQRKCLDEGHIQEYAPSIPESHQQDRQSPLQETDTPFSESVYEYQDAPKQSITFGNIHYGDKLRSEEYASDILGSPMHRNLRAQLFTGRTDIHGIRIWQWYWFFLHR